MALPAACSWEEGERQRMPQPQGTTAAWGVCEGTPAPGQAGRQEKQLGILGAAGRDSFTWLTATLLPPTHDHFRCCCSQLGSGSHLSCEARTGGSPANPPQPFALRDWHWDPVLTPQHAGINLLCAMASED